MVSGDVLFRQWKRELQETRYEELEKDVSNGSHLRLGHHGPELRECELVETLNP